MARQDEAAAELRTAVSQLNKSNAEVKGALGTLNQKVTDLEAVIAAGGDVSSELAAAVAEVKSAAQAMDDLVPDAVVVPPTE